jgi:hypothetical protein
VPHFQSVAHLRFNGILALKAAKFIGHLRFQTGPGL